jgi:hypothetical protein
MTIAELNVLKSRMREAAQDVYGVRVCEDCGHALPSLDLDVLADALRDALAVIEELQTFTTAGVQIVTAPAQPPGTMTLIANGQRIQVANVGDRHA